MQTRGKPPGPPVGRHRERSDPNQKGGLAAGSLRSPPPGSFFNENMLLLARLRECDLRVGCISETATGFHQRPQR
jgi:hypothetical protein